MGEIIGLIILGGIVGALGRLILPGEQDIAIWKTILLGVVANLIVGLLLRGVNFWVGLALGAAVAAGILWFGIRQRWNFLLS